MELWPNGEHSGKLRNHENLWACDAYVRVLPIRIANLSVIMTDEEVK